MATRGAAGQAYVFPAGPDDRDHFDALMAWVFAHAGDEKPNVLNADLIPFAYSEAADIWEYVPNYLAMSQLGTLEAVVAMLGAALEYGKATGEWTWWQRLLDFVLADHLVGLSPAQLRSLTLTYEQAGLKNLVRVLYADYDQDNDKYAEAREAAAISAWGEAALDLDCRYGSGVVLEDPEVAQLLASRLLARLAAPRELAEVSTWLEGAAPGTGRHGGALVRLSRLGPGGIYRARQRPGPGGARGQPEPGPAPEHLLVLGRGRPGKRRGRLGHRRGQFL